jgi:hypothetical protein
MRKERSLLQIVEELAARPVPYEGFRANAADAPSGSGTSTSDENPKHKEDLKRPKPK